MEIKEKNPLISYIKKTSYSYLFRLIFVFSISFSVLTLLNVFDWGPAQGKALCLIFFLILVVFLKYSPLNSEIKLPSRDEILLTILAFVILIFCNIVTNAPFMIQAPFVDVGYLTRDAVITLFRDGNNPYTIANLGHAGNIPQYWGYHYGPMMFVGYFICMISPDIGYKVMNLLFLCGSFFCVAKLAKNNAQNSTQNFANILIALLLLTLPRMWIEIIQNGVNDIFPVFLMLISLVFAKNKQWLACGLLLGLSFSAKFSPAVFLGLMFVRKGVSWKFLLGGLIGLTPAVVFIIWNKNAYLNAVYLFNLVKSYDSTSLYSIVPLSSHWVFPTLQILATIALYISNWKNDYDIKSIVIHYLMLIICIEITYREVHMNHIIWMLPFIGLTLSWRRAALLKPLIKDLNYGQNNE